MQERGILFEDPEFNVVSAKIPTTKHRSQSSITWMRPYELCARPKFISENTSRFDIEQGELGDYSLVAAVSCLTMTPRFLERFGDWVEIVVDDRLPTAKGRPLFLRSTDPTEFWPALLEKAYAKFYCGYTNLLGGRTSQTLQDMTGGVGQNFRISEHDPHVMYQTVNSSISRSTLLAASIRTEQRSPVRLRNGLVTQHAYSVTGLARDPGRSSWILVGVNTVPLCSPKAKQAQEKSQTSTWVLQFFLAPQKLQAALSSLS
ncbi:calpain-9 [Caerostris extrusa]|uniref:Calpain-9 n=1 Tax=Caerostris extrusa TaxID=172846 RepID=A0AAV4QIW1_CAEEX|nr:calpain-9 [Caerostris extrusa]